VEGKQMSGQTSGVAPGTNSSARLVDIYRCMLRIRMVEEEIALRYSEQEMRCPVHLSIGQEAIAVGSCYPLRPADQIVTTHRSHAHYLAKGGNLKAALAEIYGKESGCCGGRGGSMHLFDDNAGVMASVPIVASSIPLGVGAALSFKQAGVDNIAVVYMGDGSIEEGVFHESANFAALMQLPVLFVLENNQYAVYTSLEDRQPPRPLARLADAHGMSAISADGNDVIAVLEATEQAAAAARAGKGPTLLVFDTYRWREHCGPNYDNDLGYRSVDDFEAWVKRCPLDSLFERLNADGILSEAAVEQMKHDINAEISDSFVFAKAAQFPEGATVRDRLYA
jgi:TPP-dependent pyruvate/acetoin dehydrogenase alpha subunit